MKRASAVLIELTRFIRSSQELALNLQRIDEIGGQKIIGI